MKIASIFIVALLFTSYLAKTTHLKHNKSTGPFPSTGAILTQVDKQKGLIDLATGGKVQASAPAYRSSIDQPIRDHKTPFYGYEKGTCYHSGKDKNAFWTVELGTAGYVEQIVILNRQDCCTNRLQEFEVLIDDEVCFTQAAAAGPRIEISSCKGFAKSVTVRFSKNRALNGQTYLHFCGVTVLGSPDQKRDCGYVDIGDKATITSSQTYNNMNIQRAPLRASVGNWAGNCWASINDQNAWYQASFEEPVDVGQIMVRNRNDCCPHRLQNWQIEADGKECFRRAPAAVRGEEVYINSCNGKAKELKFSYTEAKPNKDNYLTFCGIDIYANTKCPSDCVVFYSECNFKGQSFELCADNENFDFDIASISVPKGFTVTVYNVPGYKGKKATFSKSVECFEGDINYQFLQLNGITIEE